MTAASQSTRPAAPPKRHPSSLTNGARLSELASRGNLGRGRTAKFSDRVSKIGFWESAESPGTLTFGIGRPEGTKPQLLSYPPLDSHLKSRRPRNNATIPHSAM